MHAIPTKYKGQRFRSRLEARWAAFFDALKWPWEYEPIDLDGYIPDFVLRFHKPLLVEVKPELTIEGLHDQKVKIDESGWNGEALLLGACLFSSVSWRGTALGLLTEAPGSSWCEAVLEDCGKCRKKSLFHGDWSWHCRVTGCYDGDRYLRPVPYEDAQRLWREATNKVQWHP